MIKRASQRWHTIYLLYGAKDVLLYVGISVNGPARLSDHAKSKQWFKKVVRAEFEHIKGREAAEARELELIVSRDPKWNRRGKPKPVDPVDLVLSFLINAACAHRTATIADRCKVTIPETELALEELGARQRYGAWVL